MKRNEGTVAMTTEKNAGDVTKHNNEQCHTFAC